MLTRLFKEPPVHFFVWREALLRLFVIRAYAEAEPLYQRSLAIWENALGPEHPDVATSLENYAALLRETEREDKAEEMEARAKAIRAKSE